jgi:HlyD family secretion protein
MSLKTLIAVSLALALTACSADSEQAPTREAPLTISFAVVERRAIDVGISASGLLVAREEAAVLPELSGYRVVRVLVDEGDRVRRGQALAILDGALLTGEVQRAQAQVASAQVAAERARAEYGRVADLTGQGVIAEETIAQRGFEARAAQAQLAAAQAALREVGVRRDRLTLRAPVSPNGQTMLIACYDRSGVEAVTCSSHTATVKPGRPRQSGLRHRPTVR